MTTSRWWKGLKRFGMRPGLERTEALLGRLADPHRAFPAVHVAGTNGKGSTAALIAGALEAAGLTVGLTTSPDLGDVRERVQVNGDLLPPALWQTLADEVEAAARGLTEPPTEFEALTALAFLAFRDRRVDVAVVEVGLGGQYDATNVLPAPLVTVFTSIALDHQEVLGHTLEAIARDKAGVIKPGTRVVSAPQAPVVRHVLREAAARAGVPLTWAEGHVLWSDPSGVTVDIAGEVVRTRLLGRHQGVNLATAWTALRQLEALGPLRREDLKDGLLGVTWPGRLEVVATEPLTVLDVAHNLHGARALARALSEPHLRRPWHLVFGSLRDKPGPAMLRLLLPHVEAVVLTRPVSPRAEDPAVLARSVPRERTVTVVPRVGDALTLARTRADRDGAVLVAGSFYVVGPARRLLRPVSTVP